MKKFNKELQAVFLKAVTGANYYGKRLDDKKREVVENVQQAFEELQGFEVSELFDFANDNKPEKPQAKQRAKAQSNKLAYDVLTGARSGHTDIELQGNSAAYIITSAQNNTAIDGDFIKAIEVYAATISARILVSGFTYNKTAYHQGVKSSIDNYAPEVQEYILNKPVQLFDNLVFAGELDISATATRPTNSHAGYHGDNSLIMGHTKVELQSLATAQEETPKFIYATGCCTLKNYRQQRAGQRAEATHSIAALVVVQDDSTAQGWQARQIHWNGKSFYDLAYEVTPQGIQEALPAHALTMGDIHAEKIDLAALDQAIKLAIQVKAENVFLHDLHDFTTRNHHNRNDHLFIASQGQKTVTNDLELTGEVLNEICERVPADSVYVVRSNHDEALDNWLKAPDYDFRKDPLNARLYLDLQSAAYSYIENGQKVPDMMEIALDTARIEINDKAVFLTRKDQIKIDGVILSDHGDCGTNGSRATPQQLAKTFNKMSSGHTHTCFIFDGQYVSGVTGSLKMGYNERGASSWSHSHTLQYADGNRAIITF